MTYPRLFLKKGKESVAAKRHPWVFDGAIDLSRSGEIPAGPVDLVAADGGFVGVGTYNPQGAIAVRLMSREPIPLDAGFFERRIADAARLRELSVPKDTDAYRLVNSEGDGLPGLVVDRFAGHLVAQVGTPGMAGLEAEWLAALDRVCKPESILLRANQSAANREKMRAPSGQRSGETPELIEIVERGVRLVVDAHRGQKTGFFCDQRDLRASVSGLAKGKTVLDGFSYTGAFTAHALAAGAAFITAVESSENAAALVTVNAERAASGSSSRLDVVVADCGAFVRSAGRTFDVVILDPPALAKRRQDLDKASRLYVDLFANGLRLVERGGFFVACSCSAAVDRGAFDAIIAAAAREARRDVRIASRGGAGTDHPISAFHPEGEYLETAVLYVL